MNKFYDIDLPFGSVFEKKLKGIFEKKKLEVKTERDEWKTTGNMAIELEYKGRPSGINITEADYWAHIFQDDGFIQFIVIFPVHILKTRVRQWLKDGIARLEYGGDNNESLIALVPREAVVDFYIKKGDM